MCTASRADPPLLHRKTYPGNPQSRLPRILCSPVYPPHPAQQNAQDSPVNDHDQHENPKCSKCSKVAHAADDDPPPEETWNLAATGNKRAIPIETKSPLAHAARPIRWWRRRALANGTRGPQVIQQPIPPPEHRRPTATRAVLGCGIRIDSISEPSGWIMRSIPRLC